MNAFQWDLKGAPGYDPPGFRVDVTSDFPDTSDGPTILPGDYTVVFRYGERTMQAPLRVELDPNLHPAPGDLEARLTLEQRILATIDDLDRTIAAAMSTRSRLSLSRRAQVDREISELVTLDMHSTEAASMKPTKIRQQLGFLLNSLEGALERPTAAEFAAYDDLKALAEAGQEKLGTLTH